MATTKEQTFSGTDTINTALQLIRYDIPVLILGKSSIGKSYTLIDITEKWNIPHQLLYIGSEKSENIEGIPKLTDRKENKEILEYLQPFWFPNADVITKSVKNGRVVFEKFVSEYWDVDSIKEFAPNYMNLTSILNGLSHLKWDSSMINKKEGKFIQKVVLIDYEWIEADNEDPRILNKKAFTVEKDGGSAEANDESYRKDDIADLCAYVRTALGYGNYWLILDEIDKVSDEDKDKFAPLLHIVRERTLKNFRMIDINGGKGLGIPLGKSFVDGGYKSIVEDLNKLLESGESVLDTRVIAIANKTKNIEEALFRRFVQLIAEEVMIWRPEDLDKGETAIEGCLTSVKIRMVDNGIESGSLIPLPALYQRLDEINLQWQYNFFPKMLNSNDIQGNFFKINAIDTFDMAEHEDLNWNNEKQFTAFWQILKNNFYVRKEDFSLPSELWNCLESSLVDIGSEIGISKKTSEEIYKGAVGVINTKIDELGGDLSLVSDEIVEKLRAMYPSRVAAETDKLNVLQSWTDSIIEYLDAVLKTNPTTVAPLEVSKFLVPALVNVFYTSIGNDKNLIIDNIIPITEKFQAFFKDIYELEPAFTLDCDKETTQTAIYGGTKKEIDGFTDEENKKFSAFTLFGTTEENWIDSASGKLTLTQMEDGLVMAMPLLVKELDHDEALDVFIDNEGSIEFIKKYFTSEFMAMGLLFSKQQELNKRAGKETAAMNFYNAKALVNMLIKG
jgi:hypothetical protein